MHVKGFCKLPFLCWAAPKEWSKCVAGCKGSVSVGIPQGMGCFFMGFEKINETPIYSSTSNYNCHKAWNVLASISPCPVSGVRPIKAPDSNQQIIPWTQVQSTGEVDRNVFLRLGTWGNPCTALANKSGTLPVFGCGDFWISAAWLFKVSLTPFLDCGRWRVIPFFITPAKDDGDGADGIAVVVVIAVLVVINAPCTFTAY